jgi:hypothetical protein
MTRIHGGLGEEFVGREFTLLEYQVLDTLILHMY